jgi:hypothetical protein
MTYQTTNYSQRDINQKFSLVEFNKEFEENNLKLLEQQEEQQIIESTPAKPELKIKFYLEIYLKIIFIFLIIGLLLLLFNNLIIIS